jgi:hypothetical protein
MKITSIYLLFILFTLISCKKERTCVCTNSIATYDAGTTDGTKSQAKKHCESLTAGETTCKLKD